MPLGKKPIAGIAIFCTLLLTTVAQANPFGGFDPFGGWGGWGQSRKLSYKVYAPKSSNGVTAKALIVVLHGCLQGGQDVRDIGRFNELADANGFVVLYPEQSVSNNSFRCWNWFRPQDQQRGGEAAQIVAMIDQAKQDHNIDAQRVYVVGFSAGGAFASVLANCYSDVFSKAAIFSGLSFKAASSSGEAFSAMNNGSLIDLKEAARAGFECGERRTREPISTLHIHGGSDRTVTPRYLDQAAEEFTLLNDWLDDGVDNGSFQWGEPEVFEGEVNGRMVMKKTYRSGKTTQITMGVSEMGHAWCGGAPNKQYSDPKGPNSAELAWKFFSGQL